MNPIDEYRRSRREAYAPPERVTRWEWAEKHITLREKETDFPGRYRSDVTPYVRGPMEARDDKSLKGMVCPWCAQIGKTLNLQIIPLSFAICEDPGASLFVVPTEQFARSFAKNRLQPVFDDSPEIAKHKPKDPNLYTVLEMQFDHMILNLIGSNSPSNLAMRPIRDLYVDEPDKLAPASSREADAMSLALERTEGKFNTFITITGTPTTFEGNVWKYWGYSDQRQYYVPCPHCGHMQVLKMEENGEYRLHWPKDCNIRDLDSRGWIECISCNKAIRDKDKPAIMKAGEWQAGAEASSWAGFHLSRFYSVMVPFGRIAAEFLRSKRYSDNYQNFRNSWLAVPYDPGEHGKDMFVLGNVKAKATMGYQKNQVPDGVLALTCGIDVQEDELWFIIRGWGTPPASYLITWGRQRVEKEEYPNEEAAYMAAFESIVGRQFGKPILVTCIDSGYGRRTAEVYAIARKYKRVYCTKGRRSNITRSSDGRDVPLPRPNRIDRYPDGTPIPGGVLLYSPSTVYWKRWLRGRVTASPAVWYWPDGMSETPDGKQYMAHLNSEREITKTNKRTGKSETIFVVRRADDANSEEIEGAEESEIMPGRRANHLLDCEIISSVAGHILLSAYPAEVLSAMLEQNPDIGGLEEYGAEQPEQSTDPEERRIIPSGW